LIALSGDAAHVRDAALAYRVYYAKVAIGGAIEYTVDHSAFIYLMDRDGKYLGFFPPGTAGGPDGRGHQTPSRNRPLSGSARTLSCMCPRSRKTICR